MNNEICFIISFVLILKFIIYFRVAWLATVISKVRTTEHVMLPLDSVIVDQESPGNAVTHVCHISTVSAETDANLVTVTRLGPSTCSAMLVDNVR